MWGEVQLVAGQGKEERELPFWAVPMALLADERRAILKALGIPASINPVIPLKCGFELIVTCNLVDSAPWEDLAFLEPDLHGNIRANRRSIYTWWHWAVTPVPQR